MRRSVTIEIISAALVLLLVYASLSKGLSYPAFTAQLHTHPLLKHFARVLAWAVPAAELAIAALLVIPRTRRTGLYGSALLLSLFTIYLAIMLLAYKDLPCSCGGVISSLTWGEHLIFNGGFIGLAITGIILDKQADKHKRIPGYRLKLNPP